MIMAPVGSGWNPSHGVLCSTPCEFVAQERDGKLHAHAQIADSAGGRISNVLD